MDLTSSSSPSSDPSSSTDRPPLLRPDSQTSRPGSGSDRKRRLTSPESPGRRGSEPGSSSNMAIGLTNNTSDSTVALQPQNTTQNISSSRSNVIDLTEDNQESPVNPSTSYRSLPTLSVEAASEPALGRSYRALPARTFDEIVIPSWQPDAEATHCSVCGTPFTFFFRRHHCRKCGKIVCDNCSPHRITLPRQYIVRNPADEELPPASTTWGGERVRVCNPCVPDPNFEPPRPQSSDRLQEGPSAASPTTISPPHPGMPFGPPDRFRGANQQQFPPNASQQPPFNLRYQRNSASLGQTPFVTRPDDLDRAMSMYGLNRRRPTDPFQMTGSNNGSSSVLPSGSNFYPPRVSSAIAPFATGPLPYPPPPHPSAPGVEVCRNCGVLLPFRAPDGSTDFFRNAHFAGQCGSALGSRPRFPEHPRIQNPNPYSFSIFNQPGSGSSSSSGGAGAGNRDRASTDALFQQYAQIRHATHLRQAQQAQQRARALSGQSSSSSTMPRFLTQPNTPPPFSAYGPPPPFPLYGRNPMAAPPSSLPRANLNHFIPVPPMATYAATEKDCTNADGEATECVICLEEFEVGDELGMLECFCKFHKACIVEWYEKGSGMCPTHKIIGAATGPGSE